MEVQTLLLLFIGVVTFLLVVHLFERTPVEDKIAYHSKELKKYRRLLEEMPNSDIEWDVEHHEKELRLAEIELEEVLK
jgi:hypothetical protein